jgi:hypothetical protein
MEPGWAKMLGKALRHNGIRWAGKNITGVGERHNLGNWWFHFPYRAAVRWKSGIRMHGVKKWVELSYKSWKFYR